MPILPHADDPRLSSEVIGLDQNGEKITSRVVTERAITLYLNAQEIVTLMTIGDHPEYLALGYLKNQNMLQSDNPVTAIEFDDELGVIVVRTQNETDFEQKMQKKVRTSGCAQGTIFGDVLEEFEAIELGENAHISSTQMQALLKSVNTLPSLYLTAGAIHGCVLAKGDKVLAYMEDVGRHNAVDKIAGWMEKDQIDPSDKIFYTTGRLTSEMVIKCVMMKIPILISRSGFTEWGVRLAREAGLTLVGRARGARFVVLAGEDRVQFDTKQAGYDERA